MSRGETGDGLSWVWPGLAWLSDDQESTYWWPGDKTINTPSDVWITIPMPPTPARHVRSMRRGNWRRKV